MAIPLTPVTSSGISAIGYDPNTLTLAVQFTNGGTHHHFGVRPEHFAAFMDSDSKGKHYHQHIRGKYESAKQEEQAE